MTATHRAGNQCCFCVVCGGPAGAGPSEGLSTHRAGPWAGRRPGHLHQGTEQGSSEQGGTALPVMGQPQKSLPPHSIGYKRMSILQRLRREHRPAPGWKECQGHTVGHIGREELCCLWEVPSATRRRLDFAANLRHCLHSSHLH